MKEIKYISHISRNFFLYFILFFTYSLLNNLSLNIWQLLSGLITFIVSYTPIYFLNDFTDKGEDIKLNKANLYLLIKNKQIFWLITLILIVMGFVFSYLLSKESIFILFSLYLLNYLYSFPSIRLRNKRLLREITIFMIYSLKWVLIILYWRLPLVYLSLPLILMTSSLAALSVSLYKRHIKKDYLSEAIFGLIFLLSWIWLMVYNPTLRLLLLPFFPTMIFLSIKYKKTQIPIGIFQAIYFIYSLFVYLISFKI